jgi:hypothetical protein
MTPTLIVALTVALALPIIDAQRPLRGIFLPLDPRENILKFVMMMLPPPLLKF